MANNGSPEGRPGPLPAGTPRRRRWAVGLVLLIAAAAAGVAGALWWRHTRPPLTDRVQAKPEDDIADYLPRNPGYLGPQACAPCHARRVAEFQKTSHYVACRVPRPGEMPPGFAPGKGAYAPPREPTVRFEMTEQGGDFLMTAIHSTPAGEQRATSRIGLVYGAGHADEVFHAWHDDRLYQLPVVWLHPQNCWGNISFNRYGAGDFSRETTTRCLECHNTWLGHVPGTPNQYLREDMVIGVTCERCHGPGREHVAFHRAHPMEKTAHAILNPRELTRERRLEVCTQCHSNATKHRGPAFSYRPGQPLESCYRTALTKHPEDDHVANQIKYLRQSKCFQQSELTCTTCHNPHRPPAPTDRDAGTRACLKCHQPASCSDQERLPAEVRSNCIGCHMPKRIWMNVHFHTATDDYVPPATRHEHRIAVYPEARQEVLLAWHRGRSDADAESRRQAERLTRDLVGHWQAEADRYRRDYRFLAAIGAHREALRLDPRPDVRDRLRAAITIQARLEADMVEAQHLTDERRYTEAIDTLKKALEVKPDLAAAHGKLGTLYAVARQRELAVKHLEAAARHDPDDAYGWSMLGWLAYLQDRPEEALADYRRAEEIEPWNAKVAYHRGLALARLGRGAEAADSFRKVVAIDPNHGGGCHELARTLRQQGRPEEALPFARRAARLTRFQDPDALLTLAEVCLDAGRFADAERAADQALAAARASNPETVVEVGRRVDDLRARIRQHAE